MEKLQAALDKARSKRSAGQQGPDPQKIPDPMRRRSSAVPAPTPAAGQSTPWEALPLIELDDASLIQHRLLARQASKHATPFDILRTKVLLQMQQNNWKRLAITSPMQKCGKTTIACNLALGLGRQNNLRSMLFDLDLQNPCVHRFFDYQPRDSLTKVLHGEVPFEDHCVRISPNVAVAMSTVPESDPTRYLLSQQTSIQMDAIQKTYDPDMMIFDMPSVLTGDNTRAFLSNVDCALIVARAGQTRYSQFDISESEIAQYTNVLGVVMNACKHGMDSLELE